METNNFIDDIIREDLAAGRVSEVVTRFPPEPNGYMHIGHAKAICLNISMAQKYNGKCNLRFDDTNPEKESDEFVRAITEDMKWLGWSGDVYFASDYFDVMWDCAIRLIKKGLAYIDDLTPEQLREMRGTLTSGGIESKNRNRPIEQSLALFEKMRRGEVKEGELILRAKIDMNSPNINMRDPVIYRVVNAKHHRQGDKYHSYPMYDFAHPIEDAVEKITHSCCSLEFEDHRPFYDWVIKHGEFVPAPHQYEFARLNITDTIMGKRHLRALVEAGVVDGWDDPRLPTLAALRRKGYTAQAIKNFCARIGVAKANSTVDKAFLEYCMREEVANAPRAMCVLEPVLLTLNNVPEDFCEKLLFGEEGNTREITLTKQIYIEKEDFKLEPPPKYHRLVPQGVVRLKSAYIVRHTGHRLNEKGEVVEIFADIIEGSRSGEDKSGVKAKGVVHWVSAKSAMFVTVRHYDALIDNSVSESKDILERFNKNSLIEYRAAAESFLQEAKAFSRFQFLRQGYYCRDYKAAEKGEYIFNEIVGLKDSYKPQ